MFSIQGIMGAAGVAALAVTAGGSLYYLYRSRAQKPTTTEETAVTPVEEDPETVEERQAESMVQPVLSETVMELVEEDGGVDCPQEEDQATLIMDETPEAPDLLVVTDPAEPEEAEVTLDPELCESVVETLEEDGGVDCPQDEDQATLIMDEAPEAASLLLGTDPAETEEAEVSVEPELCESVVETVVEEGKVTRYQEDLATLIVKEALEAVRLQLGTDPAETEEAETKAKPKRNQRRRGTRGKGRKINYKKDSVELGTDPAKTKEAEVTVEPELCESVVETVVEDGKVARYQEDLATLIMKEALEAVRLQLGTDQAETEEAEMKAKPKRNQRRRGTRGKGRKINYKKDSVELGTDPAKTKEAEVTVEPELCESVVETVVEDGKVARYQEDLATLIMDEALEAVRLQLGTDPAETEEAETKAKSKRDQRRRGTRGKGRKINYKKDSVELGTDPAKTKEAEVTVEPELCESVVETVVEDGKVARYQEDLATLIMKEALEAVRLQLGTDPAETEEAETKAKPKRNQRRRGTRGKGRKINYKKDSVELGTDPAKTKEAEVTVEPELCESVVETVVEDGKVARYQEDLATLIMKEALEAVRLQLGTDPAETEEAGTKAEPKKKQRRRGTRGKGRKINYKKDSVELGTDPAKTKEAEVTVA